jgi:hypothetical protein
VDSRLLIDAVVRQTTLLIAQLATSAGIRAPLAHLADQVFLELAREIEQQGVSKKVAADMFGIALRSYQRYRASTVHIPVGSEIGWETAVLDHFRAVCTALCNKLQQGGAASADSRLIGGTTLTFEL